MRWLAKIITAAAVNLAVLLAAAKYIPGFKLEAKFEEVALIAALLTILNFILKPILKLVLGPIIVLTLGLGIFLVNALILYILDILSKNLTIENIAALAWGTLLTSAANLIFHAATKEK